MSNRLIIRGFLSHQKFILVTCNLTERDAVGAQFFHTQSFAMFCCFSLKVDLRDFLNASLWHRNTLSILLQWWTTYLSCLSLSNVCKANEEQCFIIFSISVFGLREMEAGREPGEGRGGGGKQKQKLAANSNFFFFLPPPPLRLPGEAW